MPEGDPRDCIYDIARRCTHPKRGDGFLYPPEIDCVVHMTHVIDIDRSHVERTYMATATFGHFGRPHLSSLTRKPQSHILSLVTIAVAPTRRRRQPDELRGEAISAAKAILLREGPAAVTLQSVASALGMAHGSITHHFGTASNLQAAVADALVEALLAEVRTGASALKNGAIDERDLVDLVFDAFHDSGVGRLIAWLSAHQSPLLQALFERFGRLSNEIASDRKNGSAFTKDVLPAIIEGVVMPALSSSLIGAELLQALGLDPTFTRLRVAHDLSFHREQRIGRDVLRRA